MRRRAAGPVLAALMFAQACGAEREPDDARTHPPGTVLAFDGQPLAGAEVDAIAAVLARLHPERTMNEHRRAALVSLLLEREAIGGLLPDGRRDAWQAAADELERRRQGGGACEPLPAAGGWRAVGVAAWCAVIDAPLGEWVGPFEEPGVTVIARRVDAATVLPEAPLRALGRHEVAIEGCQWYWNGVPTRELAERALDTTRMEIVAPHYRDLVPIDLRQRLGAEAP